MILLIILILICFLFLSFYYDRNKKTCDVQCEMLDKNFLFDKVIPSYNKMRFCFWLPLKVEYYLNKWLTEMKMFDDLELAKKQKRTLRFKRLYFKELIINFLGIIKDQRKIIIENCIFKNCYIENLHHLNNFKIIIKNCSFSGCFFDNCDFNESLSKNILFYDCEFNDSWFNNSKITNSSFVNCYDLQNTTLENSIIENTNFRGTDYGDCEKLNFKGV